MNIEYVSVMTIGNIIFLHLDDFLTKSNFCCFIEDWSPGDIQSCSRSSSTFKWGINEIVMNSWSGTCLLSKWANI